MSGNPHVRNLDDELATEVETSFETLGTELRALTKRRKQTPSEMLLRDASIALKWVVDGIRGALAAGDGGG
jgi:hypothetical protein